MGVADAEATLVAFDADFAAATGWPVGLIDQALVSLVAVMVSWACRQPGPCS